MTLIDKLTPLLDNADDEYTKRYKYKYKYVLRPQNTKLKDRRPQDGNAYEIPVGAGSARIDNAKLWAQNFGTPPCGNTRAMAQHAGNTRLW